VLVGPEVWWRWIPSTGWSLLTKLGYKWSNFIESPRFADQVFTHSLEVRYHATKSISIGLKGEGHEERGQAAEVGFYSYF
jgi:hypothetical protein